VFQPFDLRCKSPFGAVPSHTSVTFTLRPRRAQGFSHALLFARFEASDHQPLTIAMPWIGMDGGCDLFSAVLPVGDYVGLIFYHFSLVSLDGHQEDTADYQLTVYDDSEPVPRWFGEGVTYQIFPDRFHRIEIPNPDGMVGGRIVHQGWNDPPEFRPDAKGEIRNRDFFGGSLTGVEEKLPYLCELGVETLYFCPIFEAAENHRYGVGDYERIDPMLGTEEDFSRLCQKAHALGIRVLLDGVFNHTGFVSRYFNGDGSYGLGRGAAQSKDDPCYPWFTFESYPERYDCWWGIYSLPAVREMDPTYLDYIIRDQNSIVRRWLRAGADGWRLDVADELPDEFIRMLHTAVREEKMDGVVIGEVWEDGSNKISYNVRRQHIWGNHCDGLMNYPLRNALLQYLMGGDANRFMAELELLREHYPAFAFNSSMNSLGTHDTPRILTLLGTESAFPQESRQWRAQFKLSPAQYALGKARLKLGALLLFAFPGSPTVYYGDEGGMEGFEDPFNRRTFPWGQVDQELLSWFQRLGQARKQLFPLRKGDLRYLRAEGSILIFSRSLGEETVIAAANAGTLALSYPVSGFSGLTDWMTGETFSANQEELTIPLPGLSARLLIASPSLSAPFGCRNQT
jgi:cyclomaltodextrinase